VIIFPFGQLLFKLAARSMIHGEGLLAMVVSAINLYLISGLTLYMLGTMLWLYVLSTESLGVVYPFIALSFVVVPILSFLFLNEQFSTSYFIGIAFLLIGLYFILR
jgi:drug/metabolite transporter (DMT)-like permease